MDRCQDDIQEQGLLTRREWIAGSESERSPKRWSRRVQMRSNKEGEENKEMKWAQTSGLRIDICLAQTVHRDN